MPWQELVAATVLATFTAVIAGGLMENRMRKILEERDRARAASEAPADESVRQQLEDLRKELGAVKVSLTRQETRLDTYLEFVKRSGTRLLKDMIG